MVCFWVWIRRYLRSLGYRHSYNLVERKKMTNYGRCGVVRTRGGMLSLGLLLGTNVGVANVAFICGMVKSQRSSSAASTFAIRPNAELENASRFKSCHRPFGLITTKRQGALWWEPQFSRWHPKGRGHAHTYGAPQLSNLRRGGSHP